MANKIFHRSIHSQGMSLKHPASSPGSDGDGRKRKRKLCNRESAQRSRIAQEQKMIQEKQCAELTEPLRSLNSMLQIASELSGFACDILSRSRASCPALPYSAHPGLFKHLVHGFAVILTIRSCV